MVTCSNLLVKMMLALTMLLMMMIRGMSLIERNLCVDLLLFTCFMLFSGLLYMCYAFVFTFVFFTGVHLHFCTFCGQLHPIVRIGALSSYLWTFVLVFETLYFPSFTSLLSYIGTLYPLQLFTFVPSARFYMGMQGRGATESRYSHDSRSNGFVRSHGNP